jgi:Leucine Rich repeat
MIFYLAAVLCLHNTRFEKGTQDLSEENLGAKDAKQIAEELATNTTLEYLNLGGNGLGYDGSVGIAGALAVDNTLRELWLIDNGICDAVLDAFGKALMQNDSLEFLDVSDDRFRVVGLTSFANS